MPVTDTYAEIDSVLHDGRLRSEGWRTSAMRRRMLASSLRQAASSSASFGSTVLFHLSSNRSCRPTGRVPIREYYSAQFP